MDADVVVVGAGFAGLSAAAALAGQGKRVLVLEARPTTGGRATAFVDPETRERVDNGQHVLIGCYHETFRFLKRIGADANVQLQRHLAVDMIDGDGHASRLSCPPLPSPFHLLAGALKWNALSWRDRVALLRIGRSVRLQPDARSVRLQPDHGHPPEGGQHETPTVRQWLEAHRQTPRLIELLWEPLAVAALNQPIGTAAAGPFLVVLQRMFNGTPRDAALGLPLRPLDEMYALPAQRYIEAHGGEVRVNAPAVITRQGVELLRGERARVAAGAVICAVPWYALSDVLVDPDSALARTVDAARGTPASPIVTVNLWFDRIVTANTFVGLPGRTMQWVFDKRLLFGEQSSHLSLVSSGAAAVVSRTNQDLVDLALREVMNALPGARSATLQRAVVVREKRATFSVAPGQPPRPQTRTSVRGLFLAGDWIDTGLPATIESAVVSGHNAADAALRFISGL